MPPGDLSEAELRRYYARRATEYEAIYAKEERQQDLELLRQWLPELLAAERVLEIACGTGYWTRYIARTAAAITAIDANREVLDIAAQKPYGSCEVSLQLADAYRLEGVGGRFSAAFCGFWWSHIPRERQQEFLAGLHRVLHPGARVVLLDNRYVEGSSTPIDHVDAGGNSYQLRRLGDGSQHQVLKNFPDQSELRQAVGGSAADWDFRELPYYWLLSYRVSD